MANPVRIIVDYITPRMAKDIVGCARESAGDDAGLQTMLIGFAYVVWPAMLEGAGEAAVMEIDSSERAMRDDISKGPYSVGTNKAGVDVTTFTIDRLVASHAGVSGHYRLIEVHGDEALRDKIIRLLNFDAVTNG